MTNSTTPKISHDAAAESAQRLINSHFHQEPHARISIPRRMDWDDDIIITAYIEQQREAADTIADVEIVLELRGPGFIDDECLRHRAADTIERLSERISQLEKELKDEQSRSTQSIGP